jgi:hypothetical protein
MLVFFSLPLAACHDPWVKSKVAQFLQISGERICTFVTCWQHSTENAHHPSILNGGTRAVR